VAPNAKPPTRQEVSDTPITTSEAGDIVGLMAPSPREIAIGLHFYQPPREAFHHQFAHIKTDPEGKDWTAIIEKQCYAPLIKFGLLDIVSFDINGILIEELRRRHAPSAEAFGQFGETAVGTSYIHPLMPDLSLEDKQIVIGAGVIKHQQEFGQSPHIFWPPETAMDLATAEVLKDFGYEAFLCAPEQLRLNNGQNADNQPTRIYLPSGRTIIAIPFDRPISSSLAHEKKFNADNFAHQHILSSYFRQIGNRGDRQMVGWTDAETFGHHWPFGDHFLNHLVTVALPELGFTPISINDVDITNPTDGRLIERSAWSCQHGNLKRWNEGCNCTGPDNRWKAPYYQTFEALNHQIGMLVRDQLGGNYLNKMMHQFSDGYQNPGVAYDREVTPERSLIAANVASLISRTSCATFFENPHTSGLINIVFAFVALQHLKEAGLPSAAETFEADLTHHLGKIIDPTNPKRNGLQIAESLLEQPNYQAKSNRRSRLLGQLLAHA
jgi:hypothetical protein